MQIPVIPAGSASDTHIRLAQTMMASTLTPAGVRPPDGGTIMMTANAIHATTKPLMTLDGFFPEARMLSARY